MQSMLVHYTHIGSPPFKCSHIHKN
uniref:Uncharacterized protein n=1 Tax=Anguilla anguilla TaxID=7936 RepID=A0A0E9PN85_ANGAN